tara:strand:- start:2720 stop:3094 length:375 start_codon:yes stop_codon:yes gene_type:complete
METKSSIVREVADLFELAENQANAIDAQKATLIELREQLKNKYSTETHTLVSNDKLNSIALAFNELRDGFDVLRSEMNSIDDLADELNNIASYSEAREHFKTASEWVDEIVEMAKPIEVAREAE